MCDNNQYRILKKIFGYILNSGNKKLFQDIVQIEDEVTIILGVSQIGKSTLLNYLNGTLYECVFNSDLCTVELIKSDGKEPIIKTGKVGNGGMGCTLFPRIYIMNIDSKKICFIDTQGFDQRGNGNTSMKVVASMLLEMFVQSCNKVKIAYIEEVANVEKLGTFVRETVDLQRVLANSISPTCLLFNRFIPKKGENKMYDEESAESVNEYVKTKIKKNVENLCKVNEHTKRNIETEQDEENYNNERFLLSMFVSNIQNENYCYYDVTSPEYREIVMKQFEKLPYINKTDLNFDKYNEERVKIDDEMEQYIDKEMIPLVECVIFAKKYCIEEILKEKMKC